jgi:hypothetical protein
MPELSQSAQIAQSFQKQGFIIVTCFGRDTDPLRKLFDSANLAKNRDVSCPWELNGFHPEFSALNFSL